ncbi:Nitric oxide synthase [Eumeta japonica]|uniref:nitric-oxide synthase (NADPH) n=1 Tax=Eumeta variegata TaxID=151549 RepID=A0A4C1UYH4_EUMVA|nr:Nitric oxide synthase [Eumeta japonica]
MMNIPSRGEEPRTTEEIYAEAQDFLKQYFESIKRENSQSHLERLQEVKDQLLNTGTYQLKTAELVFGTKLAWRNSTRCIGRIQWKKLQVFDCREVTTASGMFESLCTHIKYGTNKGNIRSAITVFPQRTDGKHDYRIWNPQLINYAGYREPDGTVLGDPKSIKFTEICMQLGWKPARTAWDILPLVLSAEGKDPEFFEIPREIVMEVPLSHPTLDWFEELGLRWYALPAVSGMRFDCGGLEFTANAFNGWYMSSEIACRNLCDSNRYNILEKVASKMNLDTLTTTSLWKDKALLEVNVAVLHSYHKHNVTIVDHHAASDSFMKHLEIENRTRNGCPADWIWIVPPMSSSLTSVFHQEMALYYIRPSYEYQEYAWETHQWTTHAKGKMAAANKKYHFRQIAKLVKLTSKLFARALSKRIKATILYATETGKSEQYAKELGEIFGHAFNAQVHCMAEYDMFSIEHETLLLVVTSTFGNGEPPANGLAFAEYLVHLLYSEQDNSGESSTGSVKMPTPKSLMRGTSMLDSHRDYRKQLSRLESTRSTGTVSSEDNIGPLSNVRFAVFALGSSAYPKFCHFGKNIDKFLGNLGGERILNVETGDEMCGQEQQFRSWASNIFQLCCETFCLDDSEMVKQAKESMSAKPLTEQTVTFAKPTTTVPLQSALAKTFRRHLLSCKVRENVILGDRSTERATIFVDLEHSDEFKYSPGDHVGVLPCNREEIVEGVLKRLTDEEDCDKPLQLHRLTEELKINGVRKSWEPDVRLPSVSIRELFTRFLDITTPPSTFLLDYLSTKCTNEEEEKKLKLLAKDSNAYDDWRHYKYPTLAEVLEEFPSANPQTSIEPSFHLPKDIATPIIMVGPGTGVAPFRGFWHHRAYEYKKNISKSKTGFMWLIFGCRTKGVDLYKEEKNEALGNGVLNKTSLALSREEGIKKKYVQELLEEEGKEVCDILLNRNGHFYVCGDCKMAEDVQQKLKKLLMKYSGMTNQDVTEYISGMMDDNRYHEDIFGITLRTAEVQSASRETARKRRLESTHSLS